MAILDDQGRAVRKVPTVPSAPPAPPPLPTSNINRRAPGPPSTGGGAPGGRAYPPEVERWRPIVAKHFRPEDVDKALWVIMYESSGNPQALGDGGASGGLFQLNDQGLGSGMSNAQKFDPEVNIARAAQAVYGGSGWKPWGGDGNTYNGQPFGALGNNPYPGDGGGGVSAAGVSNARLPVASGVITAVFGPTDEPLDSGGVNKGIDIGVPEGTAVAAVVGGTVVSAGWGNDGWGISVKVRDANGYVHNYGHLRGVNVKPGDVIGAGQMLGESGNTGASTGPHLSYDVQAPSGQYVDPSPWLGFQAAGDNRGHPLLGRSVTELGAFAGGGINVASAEWEQKYAGIYTRWAPLDDKYRVAAESGAEYDPQRGWVTGVQVDPAGRVTYPGDVVMTVAEYEEYIALDRQLGDLEEEWETGIGTPETLADAISRATFAYNTDPRTVDADNAAAAFAREMQIRTEAAGLANTRLRESREQQATAIAQQNEARAMPFVGQVASAPRKELPTAEDIFAGAIADVRKGLPDVPGLPYWPDTKLPGGGTPGQPSIGGIRRRATEAPEPPPIPGAPPTAAGATGGGGTQVPRGALDDQGRPMGSLSSHASSANRVAAGAQQNVGSPFANAATNRINRIGGPPVVPIRKAGGLTDGGQAFEGRAVLNGSILYGRK